MADRVVTVAPSYKYEIMSYEVCRSLVLIARAVVLQRGIASTRARDALPCRVLPASGVSHPQTLFVLCCSAPAEAQTRAGWTGRVRHARHSAGTRVPP